MCKRGAVNSFLEANKKPLNTYTTFLIWSGKHTLYRENYVGTRVVSRKSAIMYDCIHVHKYIHTDVMDIVTISWLYE